MATTLILKALYIFLPDLHVSSASWWACPVSSDAFLVNTVGMSYRNLGGREESHSWHQFCFLWTAETHFWWTACTQFEGGVCDIKSAYWTTVDNCPPLKQNPSKHVPIQGSRNRGGRGGGICPPNIILKTWINLQSSIAIACQITEGKATKA